MLYKIVYILVWPIIKFIFFFKTENKPQDLPQGKLIICANHISFMDPFILAMSFGKQVHFIAKKELFTNKLLAYLLKSLGAIPVDRKNLDLHAIKTSVKVLNDDKYLGIFPEGTRVKEVKRENIKNGISYIALRAEADILPIEIKGRYIPFTQIKAVFKPMIKIEDYKHLDKRTSYDKIAQDVYNSIYNLT
ncbi:MAG: lysophospholipid acyltransferase family protein [Tissierellia bacterium]|nr:lysophospholipid acyltransferase family protein [Tissierellia bacterium]